VAIEWSVAATGVRGQHGDRHLGGGVASERTQQPLDVRRIAPGARDAGDVDLPDLVEVVARGASSVRDTTAVLGRPAADGDPIGEVGHSQAAVVGPRRFAGQERGQ